MCSCCRSKTFGQSRTSCTTIFIIKAEEVHGKKYDYSNVVYIKANDKVIITCVNCKNDFKMTPNKHLSRRDGCKLCSRQKCADDQRSNADDFIKKSELKHVDENGVPIYGYKSVNYINSKTHVLITCKKHGDFEQIPSNHLWGYGCNHCSNENSGNSQRLTTEQFIEKSKIIHADKYDYSNVVYINAITKVIIICVNCKNDFDQTPNNHLNGNNCPHCKNKTEQKLYDALKPLYPSIITQFKQEWCKKARCLPFDFCIPEHNIIIELDGAQHFIQVSNWTSPEETYENDIFKETCANENGYSVIRILQEDVFGDKYDWLSKLQTEIENIIKDDTIIHNIYMCENDEYNNFITE
jgi:very-short-patch-repair endonuclease